LKKTDFVVRFAGEGGQGLLTSATAFAGAQTQVGYHTQTFATFPSQIIGGPTWVQARVSTTEVFSRGDELDVLVAFNREAYESHKGEVREDGVIIYDSGAFQLEDEVESLGIPFERLAKSTGNNRAANFVGMGALAQLVNLPLTIFEQFNEKKYSRGRPGDEQIVAANNMALSLGSAEADKSSLSLGQLAPPIMPEYEQVLVNGNEAICLGACHAGLQFFVGYPISPASSILMWMQNNLVGPDRFAYQGSSEIESITAVIGASFAGKKAMSATAGPGFSLMSEGLGLAWMAEIPLVIADIQRGGPSTGLPTKTEQSDLFAVLTPSHGDIRLPVIAPGTVEECFYAAIAAFNWAERYQGPVVLLSEHALSERQQNIRKPDLGDVTVESRQVYRGENGYQRYEAPQLSPMPIPGNPGSYVANGSEHDPTGDTTHLPIRHVQMTERRFSKLELLKDGTYESRNTESGIALMPWGGSKGPGRAAYEQLIAADEEIAWYYTMFLNPLPPALLDELREKDLVIVPELNYQGQFSAILRSFGVRAESITEYTGLPFKVGDLAKRVADRVRAERRESVAV
jgi:2-oxoglutarate ferredoxin oxidoreductase subunit alpha